MTPEIVKIYTIELNVTPDHEELLREKANQYKERIGEDRDADRFSSPELMEEVRKGMQTHYTLFLLEKLLGGRSLNVVTARKDLIMEMKTPFDHELYNKACGIINLYVTNEEVLAKSLHK